MILPKNRLMEKRFTLQEAADSVKLSRTAFRHRLEQVIANFPNDGLGLPLSKEQIKFVMENFIDTRGLTEKDKIKFVKEIQNDNN